MENYNVTSAQYVQDDDGVDYQITAVIDGVECSVPIDLGNTHYAFIKAKHDDADDSFTIQDAS